MRVLFFGTLLAAIASALPLAAQTSRQVDVHAKHDQAQTTTAAAQGSTSVKWTTVGSAGTIETPPAASEVVDGFSITVPGGTGSVETIVRYNVPDVGPATGAGKQTRWTLTVRYIDGDPPGARTQRVLVELRELDLANGTVTTIATFDSDVLSAGGDPSDWQVRTQTFCRSVRSNAAYYLEATLSRAPQTFAPLPRLGAIVVSTKEISDVEPCR